MYKRMKKIFAHYTTDRGLISLIYKELQRLNDRKNKQSCEEVGEASEQTIFKVTNSNG